jgi:hypothetical protein
MVTTTRVPRGSDVVNEHCGIALPPLEAAAATVDARTANERAITSSAPREQTPGRVGPRLAVACFAGAEFPHPPRSTTAPIVAAGATQRRHRGRRHSYRDPALIVSSSSCNIRMLGRTPILPV